MEEQRLMIDGGRRLGGELRLQGAKNSALPLLAAAALCRGETVLENCPRLSDVFAACRILTGLGCRCKMAGNVVTIENPGLSETTIADELMREMRSSIIFLGAVLGAADACTLSLPGGCVLGPRPIDMHLDALRRLGVGITDQHGIISAEAAGGLHGAKITLPFPSVGATENVLLAAVTAKGETVLHNAAREPEIADLAGFLNACGAKISGAGESTIVISGVERLHGATYAVMPDRIAAATYLSAAAATGGTICLTHCVPQDFEAVSAVLEEAGCRVYAYADRMYLHAPSVLRSVSRIRTMPYPGFPTDAQALLMAALCCARGATVFEETIFESRYKHIDDLRRMGAEIQTSGQTAVVIGVQKLYGAKVCATDLRGGAALLIAGLAAEGQTALSALHHLDRGYEQIETALEGIGAHIRRV